MVANDVRMGTTTTVFGQLGALCFLLLVFRLQEIVDSEDDIKQVKEKLSSGNLLLGAVVLSITMREKIKTWLLRDSNFPLKEDEIKVTWM